MKNWSTDTKNLKKNSKAFHLWRTEQLINFGLGKAKLDSTFVKKNFNLLNIDPAKKTYLSFLLWGKKSSRTTKKNS